MFLYSLYGEGSTLQTFIHSFFHFLLHTSVRRRKAEENGPEESELEERIQELSIEEVTIQDPLKWFGILVPAALRQGQNAFIEGKCIPYTYLSSYNI